MKPPSIAILIYGEPGSKRKALTEEKYCRLANQLLEEGVVVDSVLYHDSRAEKLALELAQYSAILVWVNPIEQETDRTVLDQLLRQLSDKGVVVSAHPETILKIGTKEILYDTRGEEFGGDVKCYRSFEDFRDQFFHSNQEEFRILKQYRGNGGNGVFKIDLSQKDRNRIGVTSASRGDQQLVLTINEFLDQFNKYFHQGNLLIDQAWNSNIVNGMVRCYLCGDKVAGFGYQEVNALYPVINSVFRKPSPRYYFSENCGLFADLRQAMEGKWVARLQEVARLHNELLPVIWDADFFINKINAEQTGQRYSLCEINVSCVSPFPESSIPYIVAEIRKRIASKTSAYS